MVMVFDRERFEKDQAKQEIQKLKTHCVDQAQEIEVLRPRVAALEEAITKTLKERDSLLQESETSEGYVIVDLDYLGEIVAPIEAALTAGPEEE